MDEIRQMIQEEGKSIFCFRIFRNILFLVLTAIIGYKISKWCIGHYSLETYEYLYWEIVRICIALVFVDWIYRKLKESKVRKLRSDELQRISKSETPAAGEKTIWEELETVIEENRGKADFWRLVINKIGKLRVISPEEEIFLIFVGNTYIQTLKKRNRNKDMYFSLQAKASGYQSLKKIFTEIYNQKTALAGMIAYLGNGALATYKEELYKDTFTLINIVLLAFFVLGVILFILLRANEYEAEITLRKYGETWVRHEKTIFGIENAMCEYVLNLGEYANASSPEQEKERFMNQILSVMQRNEDKFQSNMK